MAMTSTHKDVETLKLPSINWPNYVSPSEWAKNQDAQRWTADFEKNGFLVVRDLLEQELVEVYKKIYNELLEGKIDTSERRHDLGSHGEKKRENIENITQIMWPSVYYDNLQDGPLHERTSLVAKSILGDDIEFDFDMLIAKSEHTDTITPWHQDEAYWSEIVPMEDKRAVSFWVSIDTATVANGCMWFVKGSHMTGLRKHSHVGGEHVMMCDDVTEVDGSPVPLLPGSCTGHSGRTLHYTRGNTTNTKRRAYIVNYRPRAMIAREREHGFDHGKSGMKKLLYKTREQ